MKKTKDEIMDIVENIDLKKFMPVPGVNDEIDLVLMNFLNKERNWKDSNSMRASYTAYKKSKPLEIALMRAGIATLK